MHRISAAASITQIVSLAADLYQPLRKYYKNVESAKDDIMRLVNEVRALRDVFEKLADITNDPDSKGSVLLGLFQKKHGLMERCVASLKEISRTLEKKKGMKQKGLRALKWPLENDTVYEHVQILERCKSTFSLALSADQIILLGSLKKDFATTRERENQYRAKDEELRTRDRVITWLMKTDPSINHQEHRRKHHSATGQWFVKGQYLQNWRTTANSLMWLHGTSGCGKTVLTSTIIEHLREDWEQNCQRGLAFFYFNFNNTEQQKVVNFVCSYIAQLSSQVETLPSEIKNMYTKYDSGRQSPLLSDLTSAIASFRSYFKNIYIVIDALDECPTANMEQEQVLDAIQEFRNWQDKEFHILVTSRQEPRVKDALGPIMTTAPISIQKAQTKEDIDSFIGSALAKIAGTWWPEDLISEVQATLSTGANGM